MMFLLFPTPTIGIRIIAFSCGFIALCFGSSLYMIADMGVSTYDAIALVCSEKWKLGKFQQVRISSDFLCIAIGIGLYLLGGGSADSISAFVNIGTILTAFCMGHFLIIVTGRFRPHYYINTHLHKNRERIHNRSALVSFFQYSVFDYRLSLVKLWWMIRKVILIKHTHYCYMLLSTQFLTY